MNFESAKYRKKPVVIEAMRWDGSAASATLIVDWILRGGGAASYHKHLMDGDQVAHPGSFLRSSRSTPSGLASSRRRTSRCPREFRRPAAAVHLRPHTKQAHRNPMHRQHHRPVPVCRLDTRPRRHHRPVFAGLEGADVTTEPQEPRATDPWEAWLDAESGDAETNRALAAHLVGPAAPVAQEPPACTCVCISPGQSGGYNGPLPSEWEQADDCPVHPLAVAQEPPAPECQCANCVHPHESHDESTGRCEVKDCRCAGFATLTDESQRLTDWEQFTHPLLPAPVGAQIPTMHLLQLNQDAHHGWVASCSCGPFVLHGDDLVELQRAHYRHTASGGAQEPADPAAEERSRVWTDGEPVPVCFQCAHPADRHKADGCDAGVCACHRSSAYWRKTPSSTKGPAVTDPQQWMTDKNAEWAEQFGRKSDAQEPADPPKATEFEQKLRHAINYCSKEQGSDTPDFILANYLQACLAAFDAAVTARMHWFAS